jgi:hypothetical protein
MMDKIETGSLFLVPVQRLRMEHIPMGVFAGEAVEKFEQLKAAGKYRGCWR